MENTKQQTGKYLMIGAGIVIVLGGGALIYQSQQDTSSTDVAEQVVMENMATTTENTTTTESKTSDSTTDTSTTRDSGADEEVVSTTNTTEKKPTITLPEIELGPRQKAESPAAALQYFAEAVAGGDTERALSYMRADVQEQYRASFEEHYQTNPHPVVTAYFNGRVADVELIQPEYGLYLIDVFPSGSELSYKVYAEYDSSVGEFVLSEL